MHNQSNRIQRKAISILYVVLIGALGSGLWDIFLKDIVFYIGDSFVRILAYLFSGYLDHLYEKVGSGRNLFLYFPSFLIMGMIISFPIILYVMMSVTFKTIDSITETETNSATQKRVGTWLVRYITKNRFKGFALILVLPIIMSILYAETLVSASSQVIAVRSIERRLEVVRPYIDENEYYMLWSEYRLIDGKGKLETLLLKTEQIAENNSIKLPEIKLFGIDFPNTSIQTTHVPRATYD